MCAAYLEHMTMDELDDSFCSDDSGYSTGFINGLISRQLDGIEFKGLRYVLVNSDLDYVDYDDTEHYLKESVVKFINEHFNDYERYKQSIIDYNAYMNTDAKIIISTFVGCGECLKS